MRESRASCCVYMGAVDIERQAPNVDRMKQLGADVIAVESGDRHSGLQLMRQCENGYPTPWTLIT